MSPVNRLIIPALSRRRFLYLTAGAAAATISAGRAGVVAATAPNAVTAESGAFLDPAVVHTIEVTFDQSAHDAMVETYLDSGEKEWIEATVAIDGSTYEKAGMRLKGNSSLGGRRIISPPRARQGTPVAVPDQATPVAGSEQLDEEGFAEQSEGGTDFDAPERLPWLIRLDKFVDGPRHEGFTELVIRSNRSQTSLNEAVALDLIAEAGLASQFAAYTRFSVNGSALALRLAIEHPNDDWMALRFSPDGLLYKGESTGDYSYRGDDPDAYEEVFDLEAGGTGDAAEDMQPLIEFLDFINHSDDPTFATEIEDRLDVGQFAVYLATMDLIGNFDDIDGPGNNGYLYLDAASGQFTVVPWDMNLSFGGPGGLVQRRFPEEGELDEPSEGLAPPPDVAASDAATPVAGDGPLVRIGGPGDVVGPSPNPLVERFKAIADYATLIDDEVTRLRAELYESGVARDVLSRWAGVLERGAASLVDQETISAEADSVATYFTQS